MGNTRARLGLITVEDDGRDAGVQQREHLAGADVTQADETHRVRHRVQVIAGKDKGKQGEILQVQAANGRAVVQGVNIARRHTRPSQTTTGGIVDKEMPIAVSNLSHIDPKDNEPTRIGFKFLDDNRKVRYAKRSGEVIDS